MDCESPARRRYLGAGAAGLALLVPRARAQGSRRLPKIGVLANHVPRAHLELAGKSPFYGVAAFLEALRLAGWTQGIDVELVWRSAEGRMERHAALAAELVRADVDVIVAGDEAMEAAARATSTVPIVAYGMHNPVESGFAASFARPGRNITGIANSVGVELPKSLALLREAAPRMRRVALVAHAFERADESRVVSADSSLGKAARALGLELFYVPVGDPGTLPAVVASAARQGADAIMVEGNYSIHYHREHRERLARAAEEHRLPAMHLALVAAQDGALMAHGFDLTARWRRAAYFVNRILRGEKPGDIPIEHPAAIEFHINLTAARAIGLRIPPTLLLQADRVFE